MKRLNQTRPIAIFGLAIGFLMLIGCNKKPAVASTRSPSSSVFRIDTSNLQLIGETEEKERDDFGNSVRALALIGDFQNLESQAQSFRSSKTNFSNGCWKLRVFYAAFGDYNKITDGKTYSKLITQLEQWAARQPDSIAPRLALAEAYHGYAWQARGSGWATQVTEQGERLMDERMSKGFEWLRKAQKLLGKQDDPAFYAITLHSFLGANVDRKTYEGIFEKGIQNAPDYSALYEYKAYYLLPRWYGQNGEWESFARTISKRKDIAGSAEIFARAALYLREIGYFYDEFSGEKQSWEELKSSFHELESNHPNSTELKNIFCLMSAKMCDYKEAREQAKILDGKVDLSVWNSKTNFLNAIDWMQQDDATLENCRQQFKAQWHQAK